MEQPPQQGPGARPAVGGSSGRPPRAEHGASGTGNVTVATMVTLIRHRQQKKGPARGLVAPWPVPPCIAAGRSRGTFQ